MVYARGVHQTGGRGVHALLGPGDLAAKGSQLLIVVMAAVVPGGTLPM